MIDNSPPPQRLTNLPANKSSAEFDILATIFPVSPKDRPSEDLLAVARRVSGKDINPPTMFEMVRVLRTLTTVQLRLVEDALNTESKDLQGQKRELAKLIVRYAKGLNLIRRADFREVIRLARTKD